jgi:LysR family cys regulon transcriptional activator
MTLAALAEFPLVTYDATFTGRSRIDRAFERQGLAPNVVLTAIDSDVIKTYVELGLGVGIIAEMAFDPAARRGAGGAAGEHLFEINTTRLGFRRDALAARLRLRLHGAAGAAADAAGGRGDHAGGGSDASL